MNLYELEGTLNSLNDLRNIIDNTFIALSCILYDKNNPKRGGGMTAGLGI